MCIECDRLLVRIFSNPASRPTPDPGPPEAPDAAVAPGDSRSRPLPPASHCRGSSPPAKNGVRARRAWGSVWRGARWGLAEATRRRRVETASSQNLSAVCDLYVRARSHTPSPSLRYLKRESAHQMRSPPPGLEPKIFLKYPAMTNTNGNPGPSTVHIAACLTVSLLLPRKATRSNRVPVGLSTRRRRRLRRRRRRRRRRGRRRRTRAPTAGTADAIGRRFRHRGRIVA